jgi:hypothetical protein
VINTYSNETEKENNYILHEELSVKVKVKQSHYKPWRRLGGEEV